MVPTYVNTAADVAAATSESLVLDFKERINIQDPKAPTEFCRDVAQFANTDGGCLLVGVMEVSDPSTNLKKAGKIVSVSDPDGLKDWMEKVIGSHLVPATFSHPIVPIATPDGMVVAVNVPPSQHTIYLCERDKQKHTMEVLRRTSHGKEWMNPDELERHIMNGSRAARLRIEEVVAGRKHPLVEIVGGVFVPAANQYGSSFHAVTPDGTPQLGAVNPMAFEIRIPFGMGTPCVQVPYEAVRAAWAGPAGQVVFMLSERVVWNGKDLTLLPYEA
jgi:hypothetical protein